MLLLNSLCHWEHCFLPFSIPSLAHSSSAASALPEIARAVLNLAEIEEAEETVTVARHAADSQSFLLVFQTPQQRKWLAKYGNTVTCMDAIWVIPGQVITRNGRPPSDFNETWYIHSLPEVINPHPFLASYVIWLLSYNSSKI